MKRFTSFTAVLMLTILVTGCPKKPTIVKEEAQAPAADTKALEEKAKKEAEEKARADAEARARKEAEEKAAKEAEKAMAFTAEDIHFDFDRYDIRETDRRILESLAEWLMKNNYAKIEIEGHCDEMGSDDYNLALGERRAESARQYLVAMGVGGARIRTVTYGEERPLCKDSGDDCRQKNRRAHIEIR